MGISEQELAFQRLLVRMRKSSREDLAVNLKQLNMSVRSLNRIFIQLQGESNIDYDVLMQYGKDLQQMKIIIEAEGKKDVVEKLEVLDNIPKIFPNISNSDGLRKRKGDQQYEDTSSNAMMKVETEAIYRADARKQLLGNDYDPNQSIEQHEEHQNILANQLLSLTQQMKQQFTIAGSIIKEDNSRLDQMQRQTEDNKMNLDRESKILEHHAYRSCFDCMVVMIVVLVIWSFIGMVLVMRVFPKR